MEIKERLITQLILAVFLLLFFVGAVGIDELCAKNSGTGVFQGGLRACGFLLYLSITPIKRSDQMHYSCSAVETMITRDFDTLSIINSVNIPLFTVTIELLDAPLKMVLLNKVYGYDKLEKRI